LLASRLLIIPGVALGVRGGGGGRGGRQVIMHPLPFRGCAGWGRLHCLHPSSPFLWAQGCRKRGGGRKGSAPSSSRRQCPCPRARHQPASCSAWGRWPDAARPSWTAWSWCRQLDGGAGKAVERSRACC